MLRAKVKRQSRQEGRPKEEFNKRYLPFVRQMGELGATDAHYAKCFGVSETCIRGWRRKHPEFQAAQNEGKEWADNQVVQALFKRAVGYSHDDVDIRTRSLGDGMGSEIVQTKIIKHYPPDATSCLFWLKNRRPLEWRERQELTGKDGAPLTPPTLDLKKLSLQELLTLQGMMDKAKQVETEVKI